MFHNQIQPLSRRSFLASATTLIAGAMFPFGISPANAITIREYHLVAAQGQAQIAPTPYGETAIWGYNTQVPGPEIRVRQGERLRIVVKNKLQEETTIHWHGLRVPNDMDGVPHLTQKPIAPGETFIYEFDTHDAGTYWYHPHQGSTEQVGRGLYGPLIIEEIDAPKVDRDVTWVLDDWRLLENA